MSISKWDRIVTKAWLERDAPESRRWHPAKAALIYARYCNNIDQTERYLTAERMVERYKHSTYTAYKRANDHAASYPSYTWQYKYWIDVAEKILQIQKVCEQEV